MTCKCWKDDSDAVREVTKVRRRGDKEGITVSSTLIAEEDEVQTYPSREGIISSMSGRVYSGVYTISYKDCISPPGRGRAACYQ